MFKKIIITFLLLATFNFTFADLPFTDVSKTSSYYPELKYLYDAGIIKDTVDHKFHPDGLIKRDEFVGIVVGIGCHDCINPKIEDIIKYNIDPFPDVPETNPYFYCISIGKDDGIIEGYKLDSSGKHTCENNKTFTEVPFCPENNITRIEAATVLLRLAKIWNDELNKNVPRTLVIEDVDNNWYGFAKKGVEVGILKLDDKNKVYPNEFIKKVEFISMATKILQINSCELNIEEDNSLSSLIKIFDKNSQDSSIGIGKQTVFPDETISVYDFYGYTENKGEFDYNWEFTNITNGEVLTASGKFLNNYDLKNVGTWIVKLTITDKKTGETGSSYSQIFVREKNGEETSNLSVNINANPNNLSESSTIDFSSLVNGGDGKYKYEWDFGDGGTSTEQNPIHQYSNTGTYTVTLKVTDGSGNTGRAQLVISDKDTGEEISNMSVNINANPIYGYNNSNIDFSSLVNGGDGNYKYEWDFGDGGTSTEQNPDYQYKNTGTYTVILKVTDGSGNIGVSQITIQVNENQDIDSDSVPNSTDLCPLVFGQVSNNGCPIINEYKNGSGSSSDTEEILSGILNKCIQDKAENNGFIEGHNSCNSCPCDYSLDFNSSLRSCDIIFPAITDPRKTTIFSRGDIFQVK